MIAKVQYIHTIFGNEKKKLLIYITIMRKPDKILCIMYRQIKYDIISNPKLISIMIDIRRDSRMNEFTGKRDEMSSRIAL